MDKFIFILMWMFTGMVFLTFLIIKIIIFKNIYKRMKDPRNYHLNFFGKKVYHEVVTRTEIVIYFFTIPMFLLSGSYFVSIIINFIRGL